MREKAVFMVVTGSRDCLNLNECRGLVRVEAQLIENMFILHLAVFAPPVVAVTWQSHRLQDCFCPESHDVDLASVQFSRLPNLSTCTQFICTLRCSNFTREPVCRQKLVLLYLCSILLPQSYAPEPNPGPRPV